MLHSFERPLQPAERLLETCALRADVEPHESFAAGAEHRPVVERQAGSVDEERHEPPVREAQRAAVVFFAIVNVFYNYFIFSIPFLWKNNNNLILVFSPYMFIIV